MSEADDTFSATIKPVGRGRFVYPSTAALRRELNNPKTSKKRRCKVYAFLLYRKRRGW